jgi:ubiquinone/menaquinone biosynthesis C-methylase UbiE
MQRSSRVDYDALAELYDSTPHREKSADPELIAFLSACAPAASLTLLDIACGTGNQQIANRDLAPDARFVGLDGSLGMLRQARRKMPGIAWVHGDSAALPFASGSFDFVSCQYAFHHFRDKAGMLHEAFRVLRRGGRFALYNMCPQESDDWLYYAYFPEAKLRLFPGGEESRFHRYLAARRDRFGNERNRFCRSRGAASACPPRARPGGAAVGRAVPRAELATAIAIRRGV